MYYQPVMEKLKENYLLFVVIGIFIVGKLLLWDTYFFWDSVATLSKPAHFLYENNFSSIVFPADFVDDNLALSASLAFIWKIFGHNIPVTHVFFTFIGIALIYQLYKLCKIFVADNKSFPYIFLLVISGNTLVTQSLLFMTDTVMVLFAAMGIRYMLENKKLAFSLSILGLSLLRTRGLCMCAGIGLSYFMYLLYCNDWKYSFALLKQTIIPFIPCITVAALFFAYKNSTGNSLYYFREDSPWAEQYHIVGITHFVKNVAGVGRFFLDYGRIFLWIVFFFTIFKFGIKKVFAANAIVTLCIIFGSTLLCLLLVILPITNEFGPRYFIIQYMFFALIVGILLFHLMEIKKAKIISICLIAGLWSGHFWIYPDRISNCWDCILAHTPYYQLRRDALNYLDSNHIDFQTTGFFFPATAQGKYIELHDDKREFAELDFKANKYIAFSNIANWSDENIDEVTNNWILEKEFKKKRVFIRIYKNPNIE